MDMFDRLVDLTEPICADIDPKLAAMTVFDTSGIEAYVTKNNPKYVDAIIRKLKAWKTAMGLGDSFDPYKAAYGSITAWESSATLRFTMKGFCQTIRTLPLEGSPIRLMRISLWLIPKLSYQR